MNVGDLTRSTFRAHRHYSGVRMQQGRVQLDADWNEQLDLSGHRNRAKAFDVLGSAGIPKVAGGFEVMVSPDGDDLLLSSGRAWVGGHLCEVDGELTAVTDEVSTTEITVASLVLDGVELNPEEWVEGIDADFNTVVARIEAIDAEKRILTVSRSIGPFSSDLVLRRRTSYAYQPDLPAPDGTNQASSTAPRLLDLDDGTYLAFVDVWERAITALDDPTISEPALGVDTTTRSKIVWQLRLLNLAGVPAPVDCDTNLADALAEFAPATGRMAARAEPPAGSGDVCRPTPAGGYVGLENQLYRIHMHDLDGDRPVIVWSRENASVVTRWLGNAAADVLTVSSIGRDAVIGFRPGDWVELYDDTYVLQRRPGTLVRLLNTRGSQLTLDPGTATGSTDIADFPLNPQVRRWDSVGSITATTDAWIPLEDGVEVRFPLGGSFHRHDYWLVPARSALADVDWPRDSAGKPLAQLPAGVAHNTGKLAIVTQAAGVLSVVDCRDRFPALTALTAEDVTVGNQICDLPAVETVQDAIDALCRANDLRRHNRLLHGYGIVGGLAVQCGDRTDDAEGEEEKPRRFVTVQPGVALDCDGNDLDIAEPILVDVIDGLPELGGEVLDGNGDGEVCLVLRTDQDAGPVVALRKYEPQEDWEYLEGTLLLDIYNDCIAKLFDWIKAQLQPKGADPEADQRALRLRTALTNLATYPANPKSGSNVFVSETEDELLNRFYAGLKQRLRSETFCAMFDDARPYPPYPETLRGIRTISGMGQHSRVRVHPSGNEAYTVGSGINPLQPASLINRYNLVNETLVARIDPVSGREVELGDQGSTTTAAVTDVAFSPDGRRIYVAVPTRDGNDTLFRVGDIGDDTISWRPAATICGVKLVTLATTDVDPDNVYAVGLRRRTSSSKGFHPREYEGAGIFKIAPENVPEALPPMPGTEALNTVGHLVISPDGQAVFTCGTPGQPATSYNTLVVMALPAGTVMGEVKITEGNDDIALMSDPNAGLTTAWVVVGSGRTRGLIGYGVETLEQVSERFLIENADGTVALQTFGTRLVIAESNTSATRVFEPSRGFINELRLPVQVAPTSVSAAAQDARHIVVLNRVSNSLSVIDAELVRGDSFGLGPLTTYRRAAVEAFADLLGGFVQYLKDCICDHLLVKLAECPEDKDLDLAAISIRGNSVYKVCNWSRRRYVKSFPTIGYWLSMVPVLPFLRDVIGRVCCAILPEYFRRYDTAGHDSANDRVPSEAILRLLGIAQEEDPLSLLRKGKQTLRSASSLAFAGRWTEANDMLGFARGEPTVEPAKDRTDEFAALTSRLDALESELAQLRSK
jgi:hypothetical protein